MRILFNLFYICILFSIPLEGIKLEEIKYGSKVGYFPGSFDPIHRGHVSMITSALQEGAVDFVLIYTIPCDGKRKNSKSQVVRNSIIKASLDNLFEEDPSLRGKILLMEDDVYQARRILLANLERFTWVGLIGSDNNVLQKEWLQKVYMVRQEGDENTPYDVLVSSAVTVSCFLVFLRDGQNVDIPELMGGRPVRVIENYGNEGVSSTLVRSAVQKNDLAAVIAMMWLQDEQLGLLDVYRDTEADWQSFDKSELADRLGKNYLRVNGVQVIAFVRDSESEVSLLIGKISEQKKENAPMALSSGKPLYREVVTGAFEEAAYRELAEEFGVSEHWGTKQSTVLLNDVGEHGIKLVFFFELPRQFKDLDSWARDREELLQGAEYSSWQYISFRDFRSEMEAIERGESTQFDWRTFDRRMFGSSEVLNLLQQTLLRQEHLEAVEVLTLPDDIFTDYLQLFEDNSCYDPRKREIYAKILSSKEEEVMADIGFPEVFQGKFSKIDLFDEDETVSDFSPKLFSTINFYSFQNIPSGNGVWIDFANKNFGGGWQQDSCWTQEEVIMAQFPQLTAFAEFRTFWDEKKEEIRSAYLTREGKDAPMKGTPTPIMFRGVERWADIGDQLYGRRLQAASEDEFECFLRENIHTLNVESRHFVDIVAGAAPRIRPELDSEAISEPVFWDLYRTFHSAFKLAKVVYGHSEFVVGTGKWGCGCFGNDPIAVAYLQYLAAQQLGIMELRLYGYEPEIVSQVQMISSHLQEYLTVEEKIKELVVFLKAQEEKV